MEEAPQHDTAPETDTEKEAEEAEVSLSEAVMLVDQNSPATIEWE